MSQALSEGRALIEVGLILGSAATFTVSLVWLTGLVLALRGSKPKERASILRAYAACRPPLGRAMVTYSNWKKNKGSS